MTGKLTNSYLKVTLKGEMDDSGMVTCWPCSHYPMGPPVIWPTYVPIFIFNRNVPIKFFSKSSISILNRAYHINTFQFATYTFAPTLNESAFYQLPTDPINSYLYYFEDTNALWFSMWSFRKKTFSFKLWVYYGHFFRHLPANSKEQTRITTDQQEIKFWPI